MPISLGTVSITALYLGTTSISSAYLGATQVFGGSFTPLSLFSGGAQGIWLDPSDLSTMFSDRAGTIPITTPGTVVGKRLDKSGRGNHAVAPTDAARPVYGIEPKGGRRNLLTYTELFSDSIWTKRGFAAPTTGETDPLGGSTAVSFLENNTEANPAIYHGTAVSSAASTVGVWLKASSAATINLSTNGLTSPGTVSLTTAWQFFSVTQSVANAFGPHIGGFGSVARASGIRIYVWHPQLELGSTATAYQRVTTAYDITESGVATCHYVQYDGSDDSMSTAAIDFTATDKMSVFAGVRKLSDAALGTLAELSANANSNNGAFNFFVPAGANTKVSWTVQNAGYNGAEYTDSAAPLSAVLSVSHDIAAAGVSEVAFIRKNGVAQTLTSTSSTNLSGNFGNYPLFIGRRGNATLPFSGKDYGIVIVGKAATTTEITDTETWLAARTAQVTL